MTVSVETCRAAVTGGSETPKWVQGSKFRSSARAMHALTTKPFCDPAVSSRSCRCPPGPADVLTWLL